jgi:hypothetical protein
MKKNESLRGRWNSGDTLLILLALLSVVGILFRFFLWRQPLAKDLREYMIVAKWEGVDARTLSCVGEGELLYTPSGETFGKVVSISHEASVITVNEGGKAYRVSMPPQTTCDATLTVTVSGIFSDGVFFRDGKRILGVGECYLLYSERAELTLRVVRLSSNA